MSKLGYTWYPKDWGNSEAVFELNLTQRGLYRELIDMAMLNDNKTEINSSVWCRKWDIEHDNLWTLLEVLKRLNLIDIPNYDSFEDKVTYSLFIPSCEPRLNLVRGGKIGGKKSRKDKPIVKPFVSLDENNSKPTPNQRESKGKETKEKEGDEDPITKFTDWFNIRRTKYLEIGSNFKRLSHIDRKNLKDLKELYKKEDFEKVMVNMANDKYCNEAKRVIPSHFLGYFDNYISQEQKPLITRKQKIRREWAV